MKEMVRQLANAWQHLTEDEKKPYRMMGDADRLRVELEQKTVSEPNNVLELQNLQDRMNYMQEVLTEHQPKLHIKDIGLILTTGSQNNPQIGGGMTPMTSPLPKIPSLPPSDQMQSLLS